MANKHMKRGSISLIFRKIQIKITVRYHLISVRMATIKQKKKNRKYQSSKFRDSLQKEGNSDIRYNIDKLEDIMLSKIRQSQKDKYYIISLARST